MKLVVVALVALVAVVACKGGKSDPANTAPAETSKARDATLELQRAIDTLEADHLILVESIDAIVNAKDDVAMTRAIGMLAPHELIEARDINNVAFEISKVMASTAPDAARDLAAQADALIAARKASEAKLKAGFGSASDPTAGQQARREFEEAQFRAAGAEGARAAKAEGARKP